MKRGGKIPHVIRVDPASPFAEIIEDAYRAFAVPKPTETGVCVGCCMYPHIEADFYNPPIRDLPLEYLQDWYQGACDPEGVSKGVWMYLLPRILELLAADRPVAQVATQVTLKRFATGDPDNWNAEQWDVLERFRRLYLARAIAGETTAGYLDDVLCMFALGGWSLDALISQVRESGDTLLAERFFRDWCHYGLVPGSIGMTAFWENHHRDKVFGFYASQELYDRMEALALSDDADAEVAAKASCVAGTIEPHLR